MKATALLVSFFATASQAFTVSPTVGTSRSPVRSATLVAESDTKEDVVSVYDKIGITKDELAMGINPEELYEWVGT